MFYSETKNSILCGIFGRQLNNPLKTQNKNVLIFKMAHSCLVYSGSIFSSWVLLSAVVGLFQCATTVCVENLNFISCWPVYRHTVLTADIVFILQFVCVQERRKLKREKEYCALNVWYLSRCLCMYLFVCRTPFYQTVSQSFKT